MAKPLAGVRVLELARILAGPWAGQMLADLGADVIKVERKGAGDDSRSAGPGGRDTGPLFLWMGDAELASLFRDVPASFNGRGP